MSPTGSPPATRSFSTRSAAPISRSVVISPVRSGFRPTFSTTTREPGTSSAATIGKAAEDGSPGTSTGAATSSGWPSSRITRPCSGVSCTETVAPKWRSMFSVWSRVGSRSTTRVVPAAHRPASRQALFTWAEATGST